MSLVKWEPKRRELEPIRGLRDEVDRLFDEFFHGWPRPFSAGFHHIPVSGLKSRTRVIS